TCHPPSYRDIFRQIKTVDFDELQPGVDFADKYTIEATIKIGGIEVVYRTLHRRLSQRVAIKMLLPSVLTQPVLVARFDHEARAAGQLRSHHTVRVIDIGDLPKHSPFMVIEFLQKHDLGTELKQRDPLPISEAVEWIVQTCSEM